MSDDDGPMDDGMVMYATWTAMGGDVLNPKQKWVVMYSTQAVRSFSALPVPNGYGKIILTHSDKHEHAYNAHHPAFPNA